VVGGGGCSLIETKESFRAAYLGAGGSLAMVDLEREVGGGQEERGADAHGRVRGGSSRMKHRLEEGGGSPKQWHTSKQRRHLGESSTASVQWQQPSQQHTSTTQCSSITQSSRNVAPRQRAAAEKQRKAKQPGRVRRLTRSYRVTRVMSGEMSNLVVQIDMKENVEDGPMMANTELLKARISSGKANSVFGRANQVTRVSQTCSSYPKLSESD
jgi:hypothetical protein